jgi:superfamily II DNA or RNA helicase
LDREVTANIADKLSRLRERSCVTDQERPDRYLYEWQLDALTAWLACGRRGVVEAVTGSGKTDMALAAIDDAHRRGSWSLFPPES